MEHSEHIYIESREPSIIFQSSVYILVSIILIILKCNWTTIAIIYFCLITGLTLSPLYFTLNYYDKFLHLTIPFLLTHIVYVEITKMKITHPAYFTLFVMISFVSLWEIFEYHLDFYKQTHLQGVFEVHEYNIVKLKMMQNDDSVSDISFGFLGCLLRLLLNKQSKITIFIFSALILFIISAIIVTYHKILDIPIYVHNPSHKTNILFLIKNKTEKEQIQHRFKTIPKLISKLNPEFISDIQLTSSYYKSGTRFIIYTDKNNIDKLTNIAPDATLLLLKQPFDRNVIKLLTYILNIIHI